VRAGESGRASAGRPAELAREILELTAAIGECLGAGETADLLALLDRRRALMEEFDGAASALVKEGKDPLGPAVEGALRRALLLEEENLRRAEGKLAAAKAELEEFYRRRGTWRAYHRAGNFGRGCFVDTEK